MSVLPSHNNNKHRPSFWAFISAVKNTLDDTEDIAFRVKRLGVSLLIGGCLRFCTSIVVLALLLDNYSDESYGFLVRETVAVAIGLTGCWFGILGGWKHLEYPTRLFFVTEMFMLTILLTYLYAAADTNQSKTDLCQPLVGNFAADVGSALTFTQLQASSVHVCDLKMLVCPTPVSAVKALSENNCGKYIDVSRAKVGVAVFDLVMAIFNVMWAMDLNDALNDRSVTEKIDARIAQSNTPRGTVISRAMSKIPIGQRAAIASAFSSKGVQSRYFNKWLEFINSRKRGKGSLREYKSMTPDCVPDEPVV